MSNLLVLFSGDVGNGARMKLLTNMISGVMVAGLAEGMALAERVGVKQEDLLDIMSLGDMDSQLLKTKGQGTCRNYRQNDKNKITYMYASTRDCSKSPKYSLELVLLLSIF
jgi:3-hydroxyisobutyrate dehydrogenase-like beta-hydroxyacid dehydrogenase